MKKEEFLALRHWPALLSVDEVAWMLGIEPFYVAVLAATKLLKPVGKPVANGRKFYSREQVLQLSKDDAWLSKVAAAMVNYNRGRNHGGERLLDSSP